MVVIVVVDLDGDGDVNMVDGRSRPRPRLAVHHISTAKAPKSAKLQESGCLASLAELGGSIHLSGLR